MANFKIKTGTKANGVSDERSMAPVGEITSCPDIKRDTVYKWIAEKQMPVHRMGCLWKFRE